jgi:hypothetical protein
VREYPELSIQSVKLWEKHSIIMLNLNIGLLHMLFNHIKLTYAFTFVQGEDKITSAYRLPGIKIWMAFAI